MSDLHVVHHGRGRPVVVLHGGLGLDHTYMRALDRLGDVAELVYVDLRGNGRSPQPPAATLAAMADDIDGVRAELGIERWTVLGHSYGSLVGLVYALRHPARTAALVAIGSSAAFDHAPAVVQTLPTRGHPAAATTLLSVLGQPARDDAHFAEVWSAVLPLYFHAWDPRYQDAFAETRWSAAGYNRGNELLATYNVRDELARIAAAALVVTGDDDFIMPAALCGEPLARGIPNARFATIPQSGHFPFLENATAFDAALRGFLA